MIWYDMILQAGEKVLWIRKYWSYVYVVINKWNAKNKCLIIVWIIIIHSYCRHLSFLTTLSDKNLGKKDLFYCSCKGLITLVYLHLLLGQLIWFAWWCQGKVFDIRQVDWHLHPSGPWHQGNVWHQTLLLDVKGSV